MRFHFFFGIVLFLTLQGLKAAVIEVECDGDRVGTCYLDITEVDHEDFVLLSENLIHFHIRNKKGVKFLPNNLSKSPELFSIEFINCLVNTIKEHHFKSLTKLRHLDLQNNKIENVASDAFVDLISLKCLYLQGNRIHFLGKHTFDSLESLEKLELQDNEIHYLHPKIFSSISNVGLLYLDGNEIVNLDEKIFENLSNLREISITENKLKQMSGEWFKNNTKLASISLQGNRFRNIDKTVFDYLPNLANFDLRYRSGNGLNLQHASNSKCGISKLWTGLVVHGKNFTRGDFPWTVALTINTQPPQYFCTGTIISSTFVISAAHCIRHKGSEKPRLARDVLAFFGAHDLENYHETARFALSPKNIIVHDKWNPSNTQYDADLSLLEFEKESISFGDFVQPICFWPSKEEPKEARGKVVGWGRSEDRTKKHETVAKVVEAVIQTNEDCFLDQKKLVDLSSKQTFCAGLKNGSGVCTGDSGGGFVIKVEGICYLRGIVSSSLVKDGVCDVHNHAIYTNVLKYKNWIEEKTKKDPSSPMK